MQVVIIYNYKVYYIVVKTSIQQYKPMFSILIGEHNR